MSSRRVVLCNDEIYHVFNRSIYSQPLFIGDRDYTRMLCILDYYRFIDPPLRYSHYLQRSVADRENIRSELYRCKQRVEILAFCLMPNHFHLLLKQLTENGITNYLRLFQNSYAKYFNTKNERYGSLFQSLFKSVRIESSAQLIQVSRYIHLNPIVGHIVKSFENLESYAYSSLYDYTKCARDFISTKNLLALYQHRSNLVRLHRDQADFKEGINRVKHLVLE